MVWLEDDVQNQPIWPELEEIARPAREHRRLAPAARSEIIVRLCARAPLSVRELSILLDRSEAYVGDAIRPLVNSGELTFLYPDQPRHPRQKYMAAVPGIFGVDAPLSLDSPLGLDPPPGLGPLPEGFSLPGQDAPVPSMAATPSLPNQASNLVIALVVGVWLGAAGIAAWWAIALVVAVLISCWHVAAASAQFRQFSQLTQRAGKVTSFLLLKSSVTFGEIAVVYLIVRVLSGSD